MEQIKAHLKQTKSLYDRNMPVLEGLSSISALCLAKILCEAENRPYGRPLGAKQYSVFFAGKNLSRPFLPTLMIDSVEEFQTRWATLEELLRSPANEDEINKLLYTAITAFCACYDIWEDSRKTPGTFYEVLLGSVLQLVMPGYVRTKHISIPGTAEKVATDIVFSLPGKPGGLVVPAKITTRERVVQPYAHQRILDAVFGDGVYKSVLTCVSELQRDDKKQEVNEICVPGTIALYQKHLASLTALSYLDPPHRYLHENLFEVVPIRTVGWLLTEFIPKNFPPQLA